MKKILSIHSSVMIGFVGNSVVLPVLTKLGHQPIAINTVSLPAHPGYGIAAGGPTPAEHVEDFLFALSQLDQLPAINHILTGYMGTTEQIDVIAKTIQEWCKAQPKGIYVYDPVLGDNDRLYIDPRIAAAMQSKLLPLATIVTPNQFELGYLTGITINNQDSAIRAANDLLEQYSELQTVIVTGVEDDSELADLLISRDDAPLIEPALAGGKNVSGGGDLLTALLIGYLASGYKQADAFFRASKQAQKVLAASSTSRELALYENLNALPD